MQHGGEHYIVLSFSVPGGELRALTPAEREVLAQLLEGRTNAEIGVHRGTSARTVANQTASIFKKLGVSSRLELARWSFRGHIADDPLSVPNTKTFTGPQAAGETTVDR